MARPWKSRPAPRPTSITEIARRYHAAAVALAQTLGLSLAEVLTQHRESVTAIFIECGRCDVRLPAGVHLPHVADTPVQPPASSNGHAPEGHQNAAKQSLENQGIVSESPTNGDAPPLTAADLPTRIPAGLQLPCAEALIVDLRPPQLSLLIGKVGLKALADKSLEPLHVALLAERASRLAKGRQGQAREGEADVP